jgi:hypothetical protein
VRFDVHVPETDHLEIIDLCLERWRVSIGDHVEPGTVLCDLKSLTVRWAMRARTERTPLLERFRPQVRKHQIGPRHAVTIEIIAAEHGVVSELHAAAQSTVRLHDRIASIDIGEETGHGGRFSVVAELVRPDSGIPV